MMPTSIFGLEELALSRMQAGTGPSIGAAHLGLGSLAGYGQVPSLNERERAILRERSREQMRSNLLGLASMFPTIGSDADKPKKKEFNNIIDELQHEVDEWLKDTV